MEKAKKILDWIWLIVKIIFAIALVIVGIKLILWLVFPLFSLWFIPSPFSSFDWNPLTTLFGAIITGGITWYAVDRTAKMDRENRKYENNYKYFIENIQYLRDKINFLNSINIQYFSNECRELYLKKQIVNKDIKKIREIEDLINKICSFDTSINIILNDFLIKHLYSIKYYLIYLRDCVEEKKINKQQTLQEFKDFAQNENKKDEDEKTYDELYLDDKTSEIRKLEIELNNYIKLDGK